jgi:cell division protein FtsW (lipid II flippase)
MAPVALIALQPDLDSALLFGPTLAVMLLAAGARVKHLAIIAAVVIVLAPCSYPFLKPHQRDRIDAMIAQVLGDTRHNDGIGFQANRAITLAAAGGVAGLGREEAGTLIRFNRLPEEHNDMIFVVIACRWGLLGGIAVWLLGAAYAFGAFMVGMRAGSGFGRLAAVGIGAMVFVQLAVNTAMTIGLLPVSGMTLPFVSYGGSSLVCLWMTTAVLFAVASRRSRGFDR